MDSPPTNHSNAVGCDNNPAIPVPTNHSSTPTHCIVEEAYSNKTHPFKSFRQQKWTVRNDSAVMHWTCLLYIQGSLKQCPKWRPSQSGKQTRCICLSFAADNTTESRRARTAVAKQMIQYYLLGWEKKNIFLKHLIGTAGPKVLKSRSSEPEFLLPSPDIPYYFCEVALGRIFNFRYKKWLRVKRMVILGTSSPQHGNHFKSSLRPLIYDFFNNRNDNHTKSSSIRSLHRKFCAISGDTTDNVEKLPMRCSWKTFRKHYDEFHEEFDRMDSSDGTYSPTRQPVRQMKSDPALGV